MQVVRDPFKDSSLMWKSRFLWFQMFLHLWINVIFCPPAVKFRSSPTFFFFSFCFWQERLSESQCLYTETKRNQVVLTDLRRATQYDVQVRARTLAGYGSFSSAAVFRTLPDGKMFLFALEEKSHACNSLFCSQEFFFKILIGVFTLRSFLLWIHRLEDDVLVLSLSWINKLL